ncbi:CoA-binding protein [Martelella mediterranea]|uniref:CoA-binding protein n=1 Tax=Martelella mediterranea TaxID=293089 RepID=UPI001E3A7596|nr:CoA-binding protein [Martelella mediterranea]MCD1636305.1 CoA-binding protein [Martelella mediterranea]
MVQLKMDDSIIIDVLKSVRRIALVGASPKPERPSHRVMGFLMSKGYEVVPVNPGLAGKTIHGETVYGSLSDIPGAIDMVDIFRASAFVSGVVDEALTLSPLPRVIWMQLDIRDDAAAERARARGLTVIMDRCPAIEYPRLIGA